ncbi:MAG: hypothetical protein IJ029_10125 [Lachnospiraceae bacterium]|nr:hypothetical protein [Lachnospiraceae bacterium]
MVHEEKKVGKIIEELTMFFFAIGADKIQTGIEKSDKQVVIEFKANFNPAYADRVERLNQFLNEEKNEGMEDIYWELAGSGDPGETSQLLLVGMMIEKADVCVRETEVELRLYKEML